MITEFACEHYDAINRRCTKPNCPCCTYTIKDTVNPAHYKQGTIECYDAIASMLSQEELRGYLRGNMMKYTWRYRHKGGVTDLDKADWYFNKLKEMERGK